MKEDQDPLETFAQYHVTRLPVAVPLPMGHGVDTLSLDDEDAIVNLFDRLRSIAPQLEEWAQAMMFTSDYWGDKSLTSSVPVIPDLFTEGLTDVNPVQGSLFVKSDTVSISTPSGQAVINRVESARNTNIDAWIQQNPTIFQEKVGQYSNLHPTPPAPSAAYAPSSVATIIKTRADRNKEVRISKTKAKIQLMLARPGLNSDGAPILIPGRLDETFEDLLQEKAKDAFRSLYSLFYRKIEGKKDSDPMHLMHWTVNFPYVAVNPIFTGSFLSGHWAVQPIHKDADHLGQNLGVFTFVPSKSHTAEHKRQLEENSLILAEDIVSAASSHRTKASLTLFEGGSVQFHSQALTTIANLHAALMAIDHQDNTVPAISCKCLQEVFSILAQPDMKQWVDRFAKGTAGGEHLPYALILDLHNSWIFLARFFTDSRWGKAVVENTEIPGDALAYYLSTHNQVIAKWQKAVQGDTLGPYASAPSTYISPKAKADAKKSAKGTDSASPASSGNNKSNSNNGPDRRQQNARGSGSDPNLGLVSTPDYVRNGPMMTCGKRLCLMFSRKGKSCNQGPNCSGSHVSLKSSSIEDLRIIDKWITDTPNVSWATGRPFRLNETASTTSPSTPSATPAANPVSPEAVASNPATTPGS
jgi:hypothetical protein